MTLHERLLSLTWNSFSTYPNQGDNILLHCASSDNKIHKFMKVNKFNATLFDISKISNKLDKDQEWLYTWLPADAIDLNDE